MAYQLKIDEMLDALCNAGHPDARELTRATEALADRLSAAIATACNITAEPASFQGLAFAGTCVPFYPKFDGQEVPEMIAGYDDENEFQFEGDAE